MFDNEGELRSHVQKEHSGKETGEPIKEEKDAFDCDIGSDHSHSAVEGHKKLDKKFCCSECPFSTDFRGNLKQHMLTHSKERPHQCELCNKTFTRKENLTRHRLVHTGERPYVCDTCGKKFRTKNHLQAHKDTHLEEIPYLYVCDTCGKGFNHKSNFRRHVLILKGKCHLSRLREGQQKTDKKFRCAQCPYSTDYKSHMDQHLLIHSGERPHQCELCSKTFSAKSHLKKHRLVHTGERPYVCDTCGKGFSQIPSLRYHEMSLHQGSATCGSGAACGSFDEKLRLSSSIRKNL